MGEMYVCELWWKDNLLGAYTSFEEAERIRDLWIGECEDPEAQDIATYEIIPIEE
jgi:hypothetical protein